MGECSRGSWTCLLEETIVGGRGVSVVVRGSLMLGLMGRLHLGRDCGVVQGEHPVQDLSHPLSCTCTGNSAGAGNTHIAGRILGLEQS